MQNAVRHGAAGKLMATTYDVWLKSIVSQACGSQVMTDPLWRLDEPQAVEARVCSGQLVGERLRQVEDRARLVRFVETFRRSVCSTEHAGDQLLDRLGLALDECAVHVATFDLAAVRGHG